MFELNYHLRRHAAHKLDGVLVAQVIRTFDRIEHVPVPVIRLDVAQGSPYASLGRNRMGPGGEDLGQYTGLRASGRLEGRPKPGPARPQDDDVMFMPAHTLVNLQMLRELRRIGRE